MLEDKLRNFKYKNAYFVSLKGDSETELINYEKLIVFFNAS